MLARRGLPYSELSVSGSRTVVQRNSVEDRI